MKSLIVEDEMTSRIILEKILSPFGEVQVCHDGNEAIEAFRASLEKGQPFDLICMDFMMPEIDGHAALKIIRAEEAGRGTDQGKGVKVIMTTGLSNIDTEYEDILTISDAILQKPIRKDALIDAVSKLGFSLPDPTRNG